MNNRKLTEGVIKSNLKEDSTRKPTSPPPSPQFTIPRYENCKIEVTIHKTPEQLVDEIKNKVQSAIPEIIQLKNMGYNVTIFLCYGDDTEYDNGKEKFKIIAAKEIKS